MTSRDRLGFPQANRSPLLVHDEEPEFEGGEAPYTPEELSSIVVLDNHYEDVNSDFPQRIISSGMIIEKFDGAETIAANLGSDLKTGLNLSPAEMVTRKKVFGQNSFPPPKIKTIGELIMENFDDPINVVLLGAALVSVVIGLIKEKSPKGLIEGTSIMIALFIIIVVNSGNNYISERRLANLVKLSDAQEVAVYRGSPETVTVDGAELVVGDVIKFEAGMKVPADCIMIDGQDVMCLEAELTGELDGIEKEPVTRENYNSGIMATMMAKSLVVQGFGKALVLAVGSNTVAGVITEKTMSESEPTLLQQKLETIATKIGNIGIGCALLTFLSLIFRVVLEMMEVIPCGCQNIMNCQLDENCQPLTFELSLHNRLWIDVLDTIIIAISVIVCAIPEGLPLAVTISLSYSSAQMRKLNNLVRKLASSETMGGATHICSDKTGTLTLNKMTVMGVMSQTQVFSAGASSKEAVRLVSEVKQSGEQIEVAGKSVWQTMLEGVLWNSSARIERNDGTDPSETGEYVTKGNVTEQGIIKFFMNAIGAEGCLQEKSKLSEENVLCVVPFSSKRKRGSIVVRDPEQEGTDQEVRVYCKGAPDMLFEFVDKVIAADGSAQSADDESEIPTALLKAGEEDTTDTNLGILERTVKNFATQAYRTILVTYRDMSMEEFESMKADNNDFATDEDREVLEADLTAVCIFGLQDPLRPTIKQSIATCKRAGITVIMCTGDNIDTAIAISKNAGIVTEEQCEHPYTCMTGKEFRETVGGLKQVPSLDDPSKMEDVVGNMKKFRDVKQYLRVLARSSPEDKYLLVTGIQACEGVVAVTGDGSNDAPALTKADVGFSMGKTGTDIAKGASDIILLDDNFSSTVVALKYGRNVYDNVRKFLQFQLSVNVVAMFIVFFGSVVLKDSPLNAVQMLWVNLIMDTLGALALATEPPSDEILLRQPYKKDNPIVTDVMWRNVFGHAIYQVTVLCIIIFLGPGWLVKPYWNQCVGDVAANGDCLAYNPYFTDVLYQTQGSVAWWLEKNLTTSQFDQELLHEMACDNYFEGLSSSEKRPPCSAAIYTAHPHSPNDFEVGEPTQKLLHYTFVFQIFVFMQLFNQINARKIGKDEVNVFEGFFNNFLFIFVFVLTFIVQMTMVEIGGLATKTHPLTRNQNLICFIFGSLELLWGVVLKYMPLGLFQCVSLDETPMEEDELASTISASLKKSSSLKKQLSIRAQ